MLTSLLASSRLATRSLIRPAIALPRSSIILPRLISSTPLASFPPAAPLGPGSGKGGKADKAAAAKAKAAAAKQRDKDRAAKDKARAKEAQVKEKERASKIKAKEKAAKDKEKDRLAKEKKKAKDVADKAKKAAPKLLTKSLLHPPKAPQNAWQIFANQFVAERRASAPEGTKLPSAAALFQEAAPLYRALDPATKASLIAQSEAQRQAYPEILAAYTASLSPAQIKEENAIRSRRRKAGLSNKRNLRIPGAPKRPLTGYMAFVGEVRKDRPEVIEGLTNILEQSKAIAKAWKALTEAEREAYNAASAKAREAYTAEVAAFEKENGSKE